MRVCSLLVAGILATQAFAQPAPARIMPLGDSITAAFAGHASYRYFLWQRLLDRRYTVDLVGSQHGVHGGPPLYDDFDQDHEGHWGYRTDQILAELGPWAQAAQPDVVLLHLGHNDLWQGQSVSSTIVELGQIIDVLRLLRPHVDVLLAQVIPVADHLGLNDEIDALNAAIPALAARKDRADARVIVVDQHSGFDADVDTYDGAHPNESGEQKMAERWLDALGEVLDQHPASSRVYGAGIPGTLGVPTLSASANPELGTTIVIDLGNSLGADGSALLFAGEQMAEIPSVYGGDLLVQPLAIASVTVPSNGLSLAFVIANDASLLGVVLRMQALLLDPGAVHGVAFTAGLELVLGDQ